MKSPAKIQLTKGAITKASILDKARIVYNEHGLNLKIDEIVKYIGCHKSNLTNHFPNKEKLIQAIAMQYDAEVTRIIVELDFGKAESIEDFVLFYNKLMDLQYEYRSAILYTINSFFTEVEYKKEVSDSYHIRLKMFEEQLASLHQKGILNDALFEKDALEVFIVQYFTVSIHWLSFYEMYDFQHSYNSKKEKFLKSIFNLYLPYLTKKGKTAFDKIDFKAIVKKK